MWHMQIRKLTLIHPDALSQTSRNIFYSEHLAVTAYMLCMSLIVAAVSTPTTLVHTHTRLQQQNSLIGDPALTASYHNIMF
jgi:hypothetical protein